MLPTVSEWKNKKGSEPTNLRLMSVSDWKKTRKPSQVKLDKEELIKQGKPTSIFKGKAEPTVVEKIIQAPLKLGANILSNVENALRVATGKEEIPVFKSKLLGDIKGIGKVDITKSPFDKENLRVILNSAATGAEIASYLSAGGIAKDTITNLTKRGILASKRTFAEWVVKEFPKLAKEGFVQGVAYTAGSQGREYVEGGTKPSLGRAVTDIAVSTLGSVAIPAVLRGVFGTPSKKILNARETERAIANARILGKPIPEIGIPSPEFMAKEGRLLPAPRKPGEIPIELPGEGILKQQAKIRESNIPATPTVEKSPLTIEAEKFSSRADFVKSQVEKETIIKETKKIDTPQAKRSIGKTKQEFINSEVGFLRRTKQHIPRNIVSTVEKVWEKAHKEPKRIPPSGNRIKQLAEIWNQAHTYSKEIPQKYSVPVKTTPTTPTPQPTKPLKTVKEFIEQKAEIKTTPTQVLPKADNLLLKDVERMAGELEAFEPSSLAEFSTQIRKLDTEEIMNVAMGGEKKVPNTIPANAYLSIAKNIAEETNNIQMIKELANSDVASKAGQELVSSRITTTGNIVDDLRSVVLQKIRNKKLDSKKITDEQNVLFNNIKEKLEQFSKVSKQEADDIINSLICK